MLFFFLNKIDKSISKNDLDKEFRNFGNLKKPIGYFKDDTRNSGFNSTIVEFTALKDEIGFINFCKRKKIVATKRKENSNQSGLISKPQEQKKENEIIISSKISNPSFYFYKNKDYGKGIESFEFENNFIELYDFNLPEKQIFKLTTIYPGLLVGSGYNHPKLKSTNDDFQLGFLFDHTTGLPIISGSSIKGMLRSVFEEPDFLKDVYSNYYKDYMNIDVFEKGQIIFYDAYIVSTQNQNNKIFGSDYITNHFSNEENGMFKEPNPIKFLKVLPAVTFKFQFKSADKNSLSENILKEYIELFKQIILDFGLGAKTNIGYGKFQE